MGTDRSGGPAFHQSQDQDDGADCQVLRVEQVDLFALNQRDALHPNDAKQIDRKPPVTAVEWYGDSRRAYR